MSQLRLADAVARCGVARYAFALLAFTLIPLSVSPADSPVVKDSLGQSYRLIHANHFEMGSAVPKSFYGDHSNYNPAEDDEPIHPVILTTPFYLATTEVTVGHFRQFVDATGYVTTAEKSGSGIVGWDPVDDPPGGRLKASFRAGEEFNWKQPGFPQDRAHPVVGVSYDDAKAFCRWLSDKEDATYRLPTEAEWESACRAATNTHFSFGDSYHDQIHLHANVGNVELERAAPGRVLLQWLVDIESDPDDGHVFTSPVGSYRANPWGIHDLHGNVWEWCEDRYLDTFYNQFKRDGHQQVRRRAIDPICDERWNEHGDWRVIRGGSWFVSPIQCRSGVRGVFEENDAACYVGFRVVRDANDALIVASRQRHEASEAAMTHLKSVARRVSEDRNGHIRLDLSCDDLNELLYKRLADLDYSVDIHLGSPGRLTPEHLVGLARIRALSGLIINSGGEVRGADFAPLASHPELSRLQITGTVDLDDGLFEHLAHADRLESINLQGNQITDEGLSRLPALTRLHALHLGSTESRGQVLERCLGSPLREVSFRYLDDANAERLRQFQTIVNLDLRSCPITATGLRSIASLRHLQYLNLEGCSNLSDDDFHVLSEWPILISVTLRGTGAGDQAVSAMRDLLSVRDLRFGSESLTDAGMQAICELVSLQTLELAVEATEVTDGGLADFWRLANLRELTIKAAGISGSGFAPLAELMQLRRLTLDNGQAQISEDAIRQLKELKPELELHVR